MLNQENIDPVNCLLLLIINRLKNIKVPNHYLITEREYITQDPSMGFSLGFGTTERLKDSTYTLFLFSGTVFPNNADTHLQSHMEALYHIKIHNPERGEQSESIFGEFIPQPKTNIPYLITRLLPCGGDEREMVVATTVVFGAIFKIRATMERFDPEVLIAFIESAEYIFRETKEELARFNE